MKSKTFDRHLAAMWSPPDKLPTGKSAGQPLLCVASTYTFNADFFESDLLPRFLGLRYDDSEGNRPFIVEREEALRCCRVSLLVDATQVDGSQTTLRWDQLPVFISGGVQHSKVTLLMWENCVRLIVASANVTRSGYRKNREIAGALDFSNHEDSTPRQILYDAIEFFQGISSFARADMAVLGRLSNGLQNVRDIVGRWSNAPKEFTERERPRVTFVPGYPRLEGATPSSVLRKTVAEWGNSSATEITVLAPFLGQPDSDYSRLINELRSIPLARNAEGFLVLPRRSEIDDDDTIPRIGLPCRFRDEWADAWGVNPSDIKLYGIPPLRKGTDEKLQRMLHAKAIVISNETKTLLLCGSSNFSAHGMGIGAYNVEANLAYTDRKSGFLGAIALEDRLPVDWELDKVNNAVWDDAGVQYEEDADSVGPRIPPVFKWVTYQQPEGIVTFGFDRTESFPSRWEIRIYGEKDEKGLIILNGNDVTPIVPETYPVRLPDLLKQAYLTSLRVIWDDGKDVEHSARLLIHVVKQEDLLPPSEFLGLTVDSIVDCLIAGKELSDITIDEEREKNVLPETRYESPVQDTSKYLLYRIRRLGYALGMLGDRVLKAAHTEDAVSYRLMHDPFGPVQLAEALIREYELNETGANEVDALVFTLYEIMLVVAHAGASCDASRQAGESDLRQICFKPCIEILKNKIKSISEKAGVDEAVLDYGKQINTKSDVLIGAR